MRIIPPIFVFAIVCALAGIATQSLAEVAASGPTTRPRWLGCDHLDQWWRSGARPPDAMRLSSLGPWVAAFPEDAEATFFLGMLYAMNVPNIDPAPEKGPILIRHAAELGYGPARARLAMMQIYGQNVPVNVDEGFRLLNEEADRGSADAQLYLGIVLRDGASGLPHDPRKAEFNLRRALAAGFVRAHGEMALLLSAEGKAAEAGEQITAGVAAGDANCLAARAEADIAGTSMARHYGEAVPLFTEAAHRGHVGAQRNLGIFYRDAPKLGSKPDMAEAVRWFSRAAQGGDIESKRAWARLCFSGEGVPLDGQTGLRLFKELADTDDPEGEFELARLYLQGVWIPRDVGEARRLLTAAAKGGFTPAAGYLKAMRSRE